MRTNGFGAVLRRNIQYSELLYAHHSTIFVRKGQGRHFQNFDINTLQRKSFLQQASTSPKSDDDVSAGAM